LLQRVQPVAVSGTITPALQPLPVFEAVNSTLRDFTPAQIRGMPDNTLRSLASVIMDGAAHREPAIDLTAAIALSRANLAKVESLRGTVVETLHNPGHNDSHGDLITARGVPGSIKLHDAEGVVFRHYTTEAGFLSIQSERSLRNGPMSYVHSAKAVYEKTYPDLTGIFLTKPGVGRGRVGVESKDFTHYVDLRVPRGLPVLEIETGTIFLIPMPGRTRAWVADLYRRWATGGGMDPTYRRAVEETETDGGVGPSLSAPVEIVGHGRVDKEL
jgi:hypothetical protein